MFSIFLIHCNVANLKADRYIQRQVSLLDADTAARLNSNTGRFVFCEQLTNPPLHLLCVAASPPMPVATLRKKRTPLPTSPSPPSSSTPLSAATTLPPMQPNDSVGFCIYVDGSECRARFGVDETADNLLVMDYWCSNPVAGYVSMGCIESPYPSPLPTGWGTLTSVFLSSYMLSLC